MNASRSAAPTQAGTTATTAPVTHRPARVVAVVPPELEAGFRLAGVDTRPVTDVAAAGQQVAALLSEGERGVIAVYEPFFAAFSPPRRARLEASVAPVVVAVPSGLVVHGEAGRRARLVARLQRAVGYHISFGEEES